MFAERLTYRNGLNLNRSTINRTYFRKDRIRRTPYNCPVNLRNHKPVDTRDNVAHRLGNKQIVMVFYERKNPFRIGKPGGSELECRHFVHVSQ